VWVAGESFVHFTGLAERRCVSAASPGYFGTFVSTLIATGKDPAYMMGQMGHGDRSMTLWVYGAGHERGEQDRKRLRALVEGQWMRATDATREIGAPAGANGSSLQAAKAT
jgi:hypothetical protein